MTYPVDDNGNPRVDFVWGNFPLQPDQQRTGRNTSNQFLDGDWLVSPAVGSASLSTGWDVIYRNSGDGYYYEITSARQDIVQYDSHDIATTGYSNYPSFLPNYSGDGDSGLEIEVPYLIGMDSAAATTLINSLGLGASSLPVREGATLANNKKIIDQNPVAGTIVNPQSNVVMHRHQLPFVPNLVGLSDPGAAQAALAEQDLVLGNTNASLDGATLQNNGTVKSQSIAAYTDVEIGTVVDIVVYNYVSPINHTIAGIRHNWQGSNNDGQTFFMFLQGQNHGLNNGDHLSISGCDVGQYNGAAWYVLASENDSSFNTNGTKVTIYWNGSMSTTADASTGTYTKVI